MADLSHDEALSALPYPGIDPYRCADRSIFGGRAAEIRALFRLVVIYRGVLLYSASGVGKSSVLNAGLIPLAKDEQFQPEKIRVQPRTGQEIVVERLADSQGMLLPSLLATGGTSERTVLSVERFLDLVREKAAIRRPLLIFDQFEEWLTLFEEGSAGQSVEAVRECKRKIRDAILAILNDNELPAKVLLAFREDYLAELTPFFQACPSLSDHYLRLTPLPVEQISSVIRYPFDENPGRYVTEVSLCLAKEIQEQFSQRAGQGDIQLTELQIVCSSLYETGRAGADLTEAFRAQGGVQGILERYLQHCLKLLPVEQQDPAVGLLGRMLTSAGTRNVISEGDLLWRVEQEDHVRRELLTNTLTNLEQKTKLIRRERRREVHYCEIASEFLVPWIQKKAQERQRGVKEAQRQAEEHARSAKRFRQLTLVAAVLAVLVFFFGFVTVIVGFLGARELVEKERAEQAQHVSASLELLGSAAGNLEVDPERSLLLSLQAAATVGSRENMPLLEQETLHRALQASRSRLILHGPSEGLDAVVFSSDGNWLTAAGRDGTTKVWDVASGRNSRAVVTQLGKFSAIAFTQDGKRLAVGRENGTVEIWDAQSGQELRPLQGRHKGAVNGVAFSRDGSLLASASADKTVKVWDTGSGKELFALSCSQGIVRDVAFSPDGSHLATAGEDHTAKLWDATPDHPDPIRTFLDHSRAVYGVAFSPDGRRLATASGDETAKVWDTTKDAKKKLLFTLAGHTETVSRVAFSPDGNYLATGAADGTAKVWDAASGTELFTLWGHAAWVRGLAFNPQGTLLATASLDGTSRVWDVTKGREFFTFSSQSGRVLGVSFSADGRRLATADGDGIARLWDSASGEELRSFAGHRGQVNAVVFSGDGKRLATGGEDGEAKVWDPTDGHVLLEVSAGEGRVQAVALNRDGTRLAVAAGSTAKVWDVSSSSVLLTLRHEDVVLGVTFSPDGNQIATAGMDNTVRMWSTMSGQLLRSWRADAYWVNGIAFNPDGNLLVTAGRSGQAKVWDPSTGTELLLLSGHKAGLLGVAFSPVEQRVATASKDKTVKVWDAKTGQPLFTLSGHTAEVKSVAFSPDGARIATASYDGTVRLYVLEIEPLLVLARRRISRALTEAECQQYLHLPECPPAAQAMGRVVEGNELARAGDLEGAIKKFQEAQQLDPSLKFDARLEAGQVAAQALLESGENLARNGDVPGATEKFQKAKSLDSSLAIEPEQKAKGMAFVALLEKGARLVRLGNVSEAKAAYESAGKVDPRLKASAEQLNTLCWFGSLWGHAQEVLSSCDEAVALDPKNGNIRDSSGLAKALTGKREEAIADFEKYIQWTKDKERKLRRQQWVGALNAGRDPFTPEEIDALFIESKISRLDTNVE